MNKRQAKKQYKKIHGHNPPKTAVAVYTPEEIEAMKIYNNLTPEDIERIANNLRSAAAEMFKVLQRAAERMARVFEDMKKKGSGQNLRTGQSDRHNHGQRDTGRNNDRHQSTHGHDIHSKRDGGRAVSGGCLDVGGRQHEKRKGIQSNPGRNL